MQSDDIREFEVVLRMCLVLIDVLQCAIFQITTSRAEVSSGDARGDQSKHLPRLLAQKMPLGSNWIQSSSANQHVLAFPINVNLQTSSFLAFQVFKSFEA